MLLLKLRPKPCADSLVYTSPRTCTGIHLEGPFLTLPSREGPRVARLWPHAQPGITVRTSQVKGQVLQLPWANSDTKGEGQG